MNLYSELIHCKKTKIDVNGQNMLMTHETPYYKGDVKIIKTNIILKNLKNFIFKWRHYLALAGPALS